ncbi:uncharacterized protein BT62DRAFT_1077720 [Guyanagaster necrorhizus]|uniref:Uncharacterized protein n=1 Tax=Guyanagaster necrorhizus TaxID=856835 RepID=A0A9P8AQU6_9AGAR|nr:uncharacterized protein BT62DRAFT_1077720 [Guyanagaster necrorhizus MCA 3950]KAG7444380.1 hypothetical protein BT62DRAFT_1077720 [Guyanagaster necrorhizus MCA 3950]
MISPDLGVASMAIALAPGFAISVFISIFYDLSLFSKPRATDNVTAPPTRARIPGIGHYTRYLGHHRVDIGRYIPISTSRTVHFPTDLEKKAPVSTPMTRQTP